MHAVDVTDTIAMPAGWDPSRAAEAVRERWEHILYPPTDRDHQVLDRRSRTMVDAFVAGLGRQGLTGLDVARGGWVDLEWLAAEISVGADWRDLPADPYDFEDARDVTRTLLGHLREDNLLV